MRQKLWKFTPKIHLFLHLCEIQCVQYGNPRFWWTYCDEDLVGQLIEVSITIARYIRIHPTVLSAAFALYHAARAKPEPSPSQGKGRGRRGDQLLLSKASHRLRLHNDAAGPGHRATRVAGGTQSTAARKAARWCGGCADTVKSTSTSTRGVLSQARPACQGPQHHVSPEIGLQPAAARPLGAGGRGTLPSLVSIEGSGGLAVTRRWCRFALRLS